MAVKLASLLDRTLALLEALTADRAVEQERLNEAINRLAALDSGEQAGEVLDRALASVVSRGGRTADILKQRRRHG
jgi:hypothetical protein